MPGPIDDRAADEREVGARLERARSAVGLSIRRAAKVAGIPATAWADLERGARAGGGLVGVDDDALVRAARAVGLDPAELFGAIGRDAPPTAASAPARPAPVLTDLEARLARAEAAIAVLAERLGVAPEELWPPEA